MSIYSNVRTLTRVRVRALWLTKCTYIMVFLLALTPITTTAILQAKCIEMFVKAMGAGAEYGIKFISEGIADKAIAAPVPPFSPHIYTAKPRFIEKGVESFSQLALDSLLRKFYQGGNLGLGMSIDKFFQDFNEGMRIPSYIELSQVGIELLKDISRLIQDIFSNIIQDIFSSTSGYSMHCYSYSLDYPLIGPQGHATALECGPQNSYCLKQGLPTCAGMPIEQSIKNNAGRISSLLNQLSIEILAMVLGSILMFVAYFISIYVAKLVHNESTSNLSSRSALSKTGFILVEKLLNNAIDVLIFDPLKIEFLLLIERAALMEQIPGSASALNINDVRDALKAGEKSTKIVPLGSVLRSFKNPFSKFLSNVMYGKRGR